MNGGDQGGRDLLHVPLPFFLAQPPQSLSAEGGFKRSVLVRNACQFQGHHKTSYHDRRANPGSKPQKKHGSALITAQGLHRSIVDDLDRSLEPSRKVEIDPAFGEVSRIRGGPATVHRAWVANRHRVVIPVPGQLLDLGDHLCGRQLPTGWKPAVRALAVGQELDVGSTNVNRQYLHRYPRRRLLTRTVGLQKLIHGAIFSRRARSAKTEKLPGSTRKTYLREVEAKTLGTIPSFLPYISM